MYVTLRLYNNSKHFRARRGEHMLQRSEMYRLVGGWLYDDLIHSNLFVCMHHLSGGGAYITMYPSILVGVLRRSVVPKLSVHVCFVLIYATKFTFCLFWHFYTYVHPVFGSKKDES